MLSDKLKTRKSPRVRRNQKLPRKWYSDIEKIELVKLWLITGNLASSAAALNIGLPTAKLWRYSKWWEEIVQEIRSEKTIQLSNKLKNIAEKALDVALDRLENGDFIYDQKSGELRRKPVVLRDAVQTATGLLDRHVDLDSKPQQEHAQQQVQDRLLALADAFTKMAQKTHKIDVIDVEELA